MNSTILHCGMDDCSRLAVLAHRGFRIEECDNTPEQLQEHLGGRPEIHAVVFSENGLHSVDPLVPIARTQRTAPVILFADVETNCNPTLYDLVIPAGTPPADWLARIERLLQASEQLRADSRKIHEDSANLRADSAAAREKSRETRRRSVDLRKQNPQRVPSNRPDKRRD